MKQFFNYIKKNILLMGILLLFFASGFSLVFFQNPQKSFAAQDKAEVQYEQQIKELALNTCKPLNINYQSEEVVTVYNFLSPVRFKGEADTLNDNVSAFDKTNLQILEEMYNSQTNFSVNKYYKTVSNGKLNLVTVFLLDNNSSFQLSYTRSECGNKNNNNGVGYDPNAKYSGILEYRYYLEAKMLDQICGNAIGTIKQNYNTTCDFDKDGNIDSFSIILMPDPGNVNVGWSDLLWAHSADISAYVSYATFLGLDKNNFQYANNNGTTTTFGNYAIQDLELQKNEITGMAKNNTAIHELGHVLGFPDYYVYDEQFSNAVKDDDTISVGNWDIMAYSHLDLPQYPLSYNRYKQNWITDKNIVQIKSNGTYKLKPVNFEETSGTKLTNRTVAYKICDDQYPNQSFWIEYRKQTDGSFENNASYNKDGLIIYRVDEGFKAATNFSGMLTPGNFAATPYNIYVFRNTSSKLGAFSNNFYAPLNMENKSMGDGKTYDVSVVPQNGNGSVKLVSTEITWQSYVGGKRQDSYALSDVSEVSSGIVLTVTDIDQTTGELSFEFYWEKYGLASKFDDLKLYDALLSQTGKSSDENLLSTDFVNATSLDLHNTSIDSLVGLEQLDLSNIKSIDLSLNNLSDFAQITTLANLYPNIVFNLAFNNFDLTKLPDNLKTQKFVWGYQKFANIDKRVQFLTKSDNYVSKYFYKTDNQDVLFDVVASGLSKKEFGPGIHTVYMRNLTDMFTHELEYQVRVAKVFLSSENGTIQRNGSLPQVQIVGMDKSLFQITQNPASLDTSVETSGFVQVRWTVSLKSDPSQYFKFPAMSFEVKDTLAPVITLNGDAKMEVLFDQPINLPSVEIFVSDNGESVDFPFVENPLSSQKGYWTKQYYKLTKTGETKISQIDNSTYGTYLIKYIAVDNYGNVSDAVTRQIEITPLPISRTQMPDNNLYDAICELTGKLNVYQNSLLEFDKINLRGKNISSIKGLELLSFANGAKVDLAQNKISSFEQLASLLSVQSNISLVCLHFNNFDLQSYQDFAYKTKTTFGIQGIEFVPFYLKDGNTGEDLQFYAFDKDDNFEYISSFKPQNGLNTISTFGQYQIEIDFDGVFDNILHSFKFGNIEFVAGEQSLEVFDNFDANLLVQGLDANELDLEYYVDDVLIDKSALDINQTIGDKILTIKINFNSNVLKTISKTYHVVDTTAPSIRFEQTVQNVYLKKGETPNLNIVASDNYDSVDDLTVEVQSDFVQNHCGEFVYSVWVVDTSQNSSQIITKHIYVGNVSALKNAVIEYNTNADIEKIFEFEYFEKSQFDIQIQKDIATTTLGKQLYKAKFVHRTSNIVFDLENQVEVKDLKAPEIYLKGEAEVEMYVGNSYIEQGCTAFDDYDGEVSQNIQISGYVDSNVVGTYYLAYSVSDSSGNQSVNVRRKVSIKFLPFEHLAIKVQSDKNSFEANEPIVFAIDFGDINQSTFDVNQDFEWYVDGNLYKKTNENVLSIRFEKAGKHVVSVKAQNNMLYGQSEILETENCIVTINKAGFLEMYGLYIVAAISIAIVVLVAVSFVARKRRALY